MATADELLLRFGQYHIWTPEVDLPNLWISASRWSMSHPVAFAFLQRVADAAGSKVVSGMPANQKTTRRTTKSHHFAALESS